MITTQAELTAIQAGQVDALGALLAQIADLQKQADAIKDAMKDEASAGDKKALKWWSVEVYNVLGDEPDVKEMH